MQVLEFLNPELKRTSLADIVGDIRQSMLEEVDFVKEAAHIQASQLSFEPISATSLLALCANICCNNRSMFEFLMQLMLVAVVHYVVGSIAKFASHNVAMHTGVCRLPGRDRDAGCRDLSVRLQTTLLP